MGSPRLQALVLTDAERAELETLAGRRRTAQGLAASEGGSCPQIGGRRGVHRATVRKWWHRFAEHRLAGLRDEPRPGAPRTVEDAQVEAVIARTLESLPADGTHWSSRGTARQRLVDLDGSAHLARVRLAAAPGRNVQALDRPSEMRSICAGLRRESARRCWPLHGPARACAGAVRWREKPDPGARPHPAAAAHAARPGRAAQP